MLRAEDAGRDIHDQRPDGKQAGVRAVETRLSGKDESYQRTEADDSRREAGGRERDVGEGRNETGQGVWEESFGRREAG